MVNGGFLSTMTASAGKVVTSAGTSVVWSQTGYDGTAVAKAAVAAAALAAVQIPTITKTSGAPATTTTTTAAGTTTNTVGATGSGFTIKP